MEYLGLLVMGILLSTLGIVNIRGNISTIHAWNRKRVKEADIPRYGRAIGAGTLVIGATSCSPSVVRWTPRRVRTNRGKPNSCSSALIRWTTPEGV